VVRLGDGIAGLVDAIGVAVSGGRGPHRNDRHRRRRWRRRRPTGGPAARTGAVHQASQDVQSAAAAQAHLRSAQ